MPVLLTAPGAQVPVTIPDPGTTNERELERAYAAGDARDPAQVAFAAHVAGTAWPLGVRPAPEPRTSGSPRAGLDPTAARSQRSWWAPDVIFADLRGQHVAQQAGAAVARGGQLPAPGPTGNTWRAEPQPWDSAYYVGVQTR